MPGFNISDRTVRVGVLSFSLIGLVVLSIIASLTGIEDIEISSSREHIGDRVRLSGTVIGTSLTSQNSCWIFITDGNNSLEVFVERGGERVEPGWSISVTGDLIEIDGEPSLTVQSDNGIEIVTRMSPASVDEGMIPGTVINLEGIVQSSGTSGWEEREISIYPVGRSDVSAASINVRSMRCNEQFRAGDLLNITCMMTDSGSAVAYGEKNVRIISRVEPQTLSLIRLVNEMTSTPAGTPMEPLVLEGYLRYEPMGRSLYISDVEEGGTISIKVRAPRGSTSLHKGDLVRLCNCSLSWNADGLRFELIPERMELLREHGPWVLNLGTLDGGFLDYNRCLVEISGTVEVNGSCKIISNGGRKVELRNWTGPVGVPETAVIGRARFDGTNNAIYIEAEGEAE